jgi:hypothetical protein
MQMQFSNGFSNVKRDNFIRPNIINMNNYQTVSQVTPILSREEVKKEQSGKIKWGAPTWYLFHTLAEKVKEDSFPLIRKELLDIIFTICNNLPCPDCANHATRFMQGVNYDTIVTKLDFKELMFRFHNSVNARKGFPIYSRNELDDMYSRANTANIIINFYNTFKTTNLKVTTNSFYRVTSFNNVKLWFNKMIPLHFDP